MNWRISTAWHEAGHALIGYRSGLWLSSVTVARSFKAETLGNCRFDGSPILVDGKLILGPTIHDEARRIIAGNVAQHLWYERRYGEHDDTAYEAGDDPDYGCEGDYDKLRTLGLTENEVDDVYHQVRTELQTETKTLAALARRLVKRGYVSHQDLREVCA